MDAPHITNNGRTISIVGSLHRVRETARVDFKTEPPPLLPMRRPLRVARMLARAHTLAARLEADEFTSHAHIACTYGFTRARVSQLLSLTLLAPDIQEEILFAEVLPGEEPVTEHMVRDLTCIGSWNEQRILWRQMRRDTGLFITEPT
jgi:hypothetical protein